MRWPWQRAERPEPAPFLADANADTDTGTTAAPSGIELASPAAPSPSPEPPLAPRGWAFLPPLQRTIAEAPSLTRPLAFPGDLATRAVPTTTTALGHLVSDQVPGGVVDGLGTGLSGVLAGPATSHTADAAPGSPADSLLAGPGASLAPVQRATLSSGTTARTAAASSRSLARVAERPAGLPTLTTANVATAVGTPAAVRASAVSASADPPGSPLTADGPAHATSIAGPIGLPDVSPPALQLSRDTAPELTLRSAATPEGLATTPQSSPAWDHLPAGAIRDDDATTVPILAASRDPGWPADPSPGRSAEAPPLQRSPGRSADVRPPNQQAATTPVQRAASWAQPEVRRAGLGPPLRPSTTDPAGGSAGGTGVATSTPAGAADTRTPPSPSLPLQRSASASTTTDGTASHDLASLSAALDVAATGPWEGRTPASSSATDGGAPAGSGAVDSGAVDSGAARGETSGNGTGPDGAGLPEASTAGSSAPIEPSPATPSSGPEAATALAPTPPVVQRGTLGGTWLLEHGPGTLQRLTSPSLPQAAAFVVRARPQPPGVQRLADDAPAGRQDQGIEGSLQRSTRPAAGAGASPRSDGAASATRQPGTGELARTTETPRATSATPVQHAAPGPSVQRTAAATPVPIARQAAAGAANGGRPTSAETSTETAESASGQAGTADTPVVQTLAVEPPGHRGYLQRLLDLATPREGAWPDLALAGSETSEASAPAISESGSFSSGAAAAESSAGGTPTADSPADGSSIESGSTIPTAPESSVGSLPGPSLTVGLGRSSTVELGGTVQRQSADDAARHRGDAPPTRNAAAPGPAALDSSAVGSTLAATASPVVVSEVVAQRSIPSGLPTSGLPTSGLPTSGPPTSAAPRQLQRSLSDPVALSPRVPSPGSGWSPSSSTLTSPSAWSSSPSPSPWSSSPEPTFTPSSSPPSLAPAPLTLPVRVQRAAVEQAPSSASLLTPPEPVTDARSTTIQRATSSADEAASPDLAPNAAHPGGLPPDLDIEALAKKLADPILRYVRADVLRGRERLGHRADV